MLSRRCLYEMRARYRVQLQDERAGECAASRKDIRRRQPSRSPVVWLVCIEEEICRLLFLHLPFIRYEFCRWPARHLQSANVSFADGKQKICRRQVRRWPSAKFTRDKRQKKILPSANCYFFNGKFISLHSAAFWGAARAVHAV